MWVDLDRAAVGLLEKQQTQWVGEWEGDVLFLEKHRAPSLSCFLDAPCVQWEDSLKKAILRLSGDASLERAPPGEAFRGELLCYQQKGVDWLSFLHKWGFGALLADEMGLGKTVQVLAFFSQIQRHLPILVIAPTSLLFNWRSEFARFLGVQPYIHVGPNRLKCADALQKLDWIITSYAVLRLDEELLSRVEYEVIALDESNAIKTASTQTAQASYSLSGQLKSQSVALRWKTDWMRFGPNFGS
jgi:SNF2 family DNA or RNA helicase